MSAVLVWDCLKDTANDAALFDNIKYLLFIQVRIQHYVCLYHFLHSDNGGVIGMIHIHTHTHTCKHTCTSPPFCCTSIEQTYKAAIRCVFCPCCFAPVCWCVFGERKHSACSSHTAVAREEYWFTGGNFLLITLCCKRVISCSAVQGWCSDFTLFQITRYALHSSTVHCASWCLTPGCWYYSNVLMS